MKTFQKANINMYMLAESVPLSQLSMVLVVAFRIGLGLGWRPDELYTIELT